MSIKWWLLKRLSRGLTKKANSNWLRTHADVLLPPPGLGVDFFHNSVTVTSKRIKIYSILHAELCKYTIVCCPSWKVFRCHPSSKAYILCTASLYNDGGWNIHKHIGKMLQCLILNPGKGDVDDKSHIVIWLWQHTVLSLKRKHFFNISW